MQQKIKEDVKSNVSYQDLNIERPRSRTYIKQEDEDTKESLKCALYSPVKIEAPSLEISKYESSVENKHCSICNITFKLVKSFRDHELHSHKTKEIPIIDLKTLCCNVCNKKFLNTTLYRKHMADLNNIRVPFIRTKPDPSKTPDDNGPNKYCWWCNVTFKGSPNYTSHLINVHRMSSRTCRQKNMKPTIDILSLYCDTCMKTNTTRKNYIQHLVKYHGMILPNVYSEPSNFDSISLYCKVCDIVCKNRLHFIGHLRRIHQTALPFCPDLTPNINDKNNYCIACDITLCNRYGYLQHLSSFHLERIPELYQGIDCKNSVKEDVKSKKYCADCNKKFLQKSLYHIHLDKIHGIKPLNCFPTANDPDVNRPNNHCTPCDKTFQRRDVYRRHMTSVHNILVTTGRPYTKRNITPVVGFFKGYCNICNTVCPTLTSYEGHMSKYHHINPARTNSLSSVVNHNEIPVIDEIGNTCTACDKTYASKTTYKKHLYGIHGITPQIDYDKEKHCAYCNRTYSSKASCKRHLATLHDIRERKLCKKSKTKV